MIPPDFHVGNLVIFFDDIDQYCRDKEAIQRIDDTIRFFRNLVRSPDELTVISTVRREHAAWHKLQFDDSKTWSQFELVDLDEVNEMQSHNFMLNLSERYGLEFKPTSLEEIARKNDGTFLKYCSMLCVAG